MRTGLVLLLLIMSVTAFAAPDYVQEKKWADKITPTITVGDTVYLEQKNRHKFLGIYTKGTDNKGSVVVVHGKGVHPDSGLIGALRQGLASRGYTTLSIQMPVLGEQAQYNDYLPLFPEAVERLQLAVSYLRGKGHKKIAIVSHSIGSHMSHTYMVKNLNEVSAWVSLGMPSQETYDHVKAPVLDVYGANDLPQVLAGASKRKASLKDNGASTQTTIANADHFYAGQEETLMKTIKSFLDNLK